VGVIIRPLQCNEAVRHKTIYFQTDPEWYTYVYEIRVKDVIYLVACVEMYIRWFIVQDNTRSSVQVLT
jgi:hypothetical protein